MTSYEALFIVRPDVDEADLEKVIGRVEDVVKSNEGTIVESQVWGKKRLAYEVKGHTEGIYVKINFDALPIVVEKLQDHFRLNEDVIRDLVVRDERRDAKPAPVADESAPVAEDTPEQSTQTKPAPVEDESAPVAEDTPEQPTQTDPAPAEDESAEDVKETEQVVELEEVAEEGQTEHENREG